VEPRDDRAVVAFHSVTGPHNDGLRLLVVDPTPEVDFPITLRYTPVTGEAIDIDLNALTTEPVNRVVDDLGNRFIAAALEVTPTDCARGFLGGGWQQLGPNVGRMKGYVATAGGEGIGHVRGIYGIREDGEQVFFGKYIGLDGTFRGIFGGTWGEGEFRGLWKTLAGDQGGLHGLYIDLGVGPTPHGAFLGTWAEMACVPPVVSAP
jgi:hypothetical protein